MRVAWVLFAGAFAGMVETEEVEGGLMSEQELDEMYEELDADKDGKLLESEVWGSLLEDLGEETADAPELVERLKTVLKDSDANKDGAISKPELSSFIQGAQSILDEMDVEEEDEDEGEAEIEEDA